MKELLKKLIEQDSSNPPGNEKGAVEVIEKYLNDNKIGYNIYAKEEDRPNLIVRIGEGSTKILIAAHTDIVPAGDGWNTDPFKGIIKKGRMYGRGAIDNKGPLAAILVLATELKKIEKKLNGQVIILAVADEETGSEYGMKYLLEQNLIQANYAIIPDISGNCTQIDIAEKGALFINVTAYGKQAHGSRPEFGINAIDHMMKFNQKIKRCKFLKIKHKILGKPTINLGEINGGAKHNIVPGKCVAGYDIRYVPGVTKNEILEELKKIAASIGKFEFEILTHHIPTEVDKDNILVKELKKNIKKIMKVDGKIIGLEGATVCKSLIENNVLAVGFSAGDHELVHCANESIDLKELEQFKKILYLTLKGVLTKDF